MLEIGVFIVCRCRKPGSVAFSVLLCHAASHLLHVVEALVVAIEGEERIVRAALHDAPFVEHQNFVGMADGRKAVGDGDGGTGGHEAFERFLHQTFALGVERRGGLVENEDVGIFQNGTRNGHPLPLSARKSTAPIAHGGVVALFGGDDEIVGIGDFCRFDHLLHRGIFDPESDVVEKRVVEEDSLLIDVANEGAEVAQAERAHIVAVDEDAARRDIVVARKEVDEGALTAATLPHQGHRLPTAYGEADAANDGCRGFDTSVGVRKFDIAKLNLFLQRRELYGRCRFADGIFGKEDFVDALHRGHTFRDGVAGFGEVFERLEHTVEHDHVEDEGGGVDGAVVGEDERAAIPQHEHDEARAEKFAHRMGRTLTRGHSGRDGAEVVGRVLKSALHLSFCPEGFDDAHTAQSLFELRHRFAPFRLSLQTGTLEFAPHLTHRPPDAREHDEGEEGELPRGVDQYTEIEKEENGIFDEHLQTPHHRVFNLVDVAAHASDDVALAFVAEEGEGETGDFAVDGIADVAHNAGADGHHRGHGGKITAGLHAGGDHQKQTDNQERGAGTVLLNELCGVEIEVVDENVFHRLSCRIPCDERIVRLVGAKEQVEHRDDGEERKDVEHGAQHIEGERKGQIALVGRHVTAHHQKKIFHGGDGVGGICAKIRQKSGNALFFAQKLIGCAHFSRGDGGACPMRG